MITEDSSRDLSPRQKMQFPGFGFTAAPPAWQGGTWLHDLEESAFKCNSLNCISSHIIIVIPAWSCWLGAVPLMQHQTYQHGLNVVSPLLCSKWEKKKKKKKRTQRGTINEKQFPSDSDAICQYAPSSALWKHRHHHFLILAASAGRSPIWLNSSRL